MLTLPESAAPTPPGALITNAPPDPVPGAVGTALSAAFVLEANPPVTVELEATAPVVEESVVTCAAEEVAEANLVADLVVV